PTNILTWLSTRIAATMLCSTGWICEHFVNAGTTLPNELGSQLPIHQDWLASLAWVLPDSPGEPFAGLVKDSGAIQAARSKPQHDQRADSYHLKKRAHSRSS